MGRTNAEELARLPARRRGRDGHIHYNQSAWKCTRPAARSTGIVMGVGYALIEELLFADLKATTQHFGDYKIPTIRDVPPNTQGGFGNPPSAADPITA